MIKSRQEDADRKFYDLPMQSNEDLSEASTEKKMVTSNNLPCSSTNTLLEHIANSEIGNNEPFISPFGTRRVVYCDYTASGRSLSFIESFIRDQVLNEYGNTHTTTTVTALQTTLFRNEARDYIKACVNAGEHDCLIFVGSGCTGAVHKLINGLNLQEPPIVVVSPYEHHSNLLPWRETMADMVYATEAEDGSIDLQDLEIKLKKYEKEESRVKIGSFCAASNITGTIAEIDKITILLHRYGFLAFWDYATAAAYIKIDMNPFIKKEDHTELAYKDAIFLSTHKFIGGPQTPGILLAKKDLFRNRTPNGCGGGTVFYVTKKDHRYLKSDEMREEGGTPAIIESIRAGLVFQLKQAVGVDVILERERYFTKKAIQHLTSLKNVHILGSLSVERLALFSFLVKHEQTGLYLHSNFVSSLLNDLFGIQTRSGCACAGPFAQHLLGISYELSKTFEECLIQDERIDRRHLRIKLESTKAEIIRPGFTRFNLAYFFSEERVEFVLNAIAFVAEYGWRFLPLYSINLETGEFRHRNFQIFRDRKWLGHVHYKNGVFEYTRKVVNSKESMQDCPQTDKECLDNAYKLLETINKQTLQIGDQRLIFSQEISKLRWFLLPSEAYGVLHDIESLYSREKLTPPFRPRTYQTNDLNNLYDAKYVEKNANADNFSSDYAHFAETYYSNEELEKFIKIIRSEVIEEENKDGRQFHVKKYPPKNNEQVDNDQVQVEDKSVFCELKKLNIQNSTNTTSIQRIAANHEWCNPPKIIFKPFIEAVEEFEMIKNGDRLLVCLSGGKDSLSLLHAIRQYKFVAKSKNIEFEFGAVTVDPKSAGYNPSSLKDYLAQLNVPYFYEEQDILETAENLPYECASICSFCSRMKRGRIYKTARQHGYNVLALGQHLDDLTESFMMSLFYNGKLWSMKASYQNEDGDLRIIRPFVYVREKDLRAFAEQNKLPVIAENCPACFEAPKERQRMKQLLAQQELNFPYLFNSLLSAIKPIISIDKCKLSIKSLSEFALKLVKREPVLYGQLLANERDYQQEESGNYDNNKSQPNLDDSY